MSAGNKCLLCSFLMQHNKRDLYQLKAYCVQHVAAPLQFIKIVAKTTVDSVFI